MYTLPTNLIESALALTGKTTSYVEEDVLDEFLDYTPTFSYPKFYAYLLSPEFIEKYEKQTKQDMHYIDTKKDLYRLFWQAIGEHQAKDEKLLISLLSNI